jgi:hypothetical protein
MKCEYDCEYQAVVVSSRSNRALCAGHALVYLHEAVEYAKTDKFRFYAVSDIQKGAIVLPPAEKI